MTSLMGSHFRRASGSVVLLGVLLLISACGSDSGGSGGSADGNSCEVNTTPVANICYPASEQGPFPPITEYATTSSVPVNGGAGGNEPIQNRFSWTAAANTRNVEVALPLGDPSSPDDNPTNHAAGKWPLVIYFGADNAFNLTLSNEPNCGSPAGKSFICTHFQLRNILLMKLLKKGFAVMLPGVFFGDEWYFSQATDADLPQDNCCQSYVGGVTCDSTQAPPTDSGQCKANYWPGPDQSFLGTLFDRIDDGSIGSGTLDMSRVSIMGYSVGGQIVSRLINEAAKQEASWTPAGNPFPGLVSAMLLSAGSYYCYASESSEIPGGGGASSCPPPSLNVTELEYWAPPYPASYTGQTPSSPVAWTSHPATILAQLRDDNNANENASSWYYDVLSSYTPSDQAELCRVRLSDDFYRTCLAGETPAGQEFFIKHAFFPESVEPIYQFILKANGG